MRRSGRDRKGAKSCTWYGSVLGGISPIAHPGAHCPVGHVVGPLGGLWDASHHVGGVPASDLILSPQFQPTLENPQAFAVGPFPCSQLLPLGRAPATQHKSGFLPRHALGHGQLMPPYHCRWGVGQGGLFPLFAAPWLTSSFLRLSQRRMQISNCTLNKCSEVSCLSLLADALKSYDPSGWGARGALSARSGTPYPMPPPISTPWAYRNLIGGGREVSGALGMGLGALPLRRMER